MEHYILRSLAEMQRSIGSVAETRPTVSEYCRGRREALLAEVKLPVRAAVQCCCEWAGVLSRQAGRLSREAELAVTTGRFTSLVRCWILFGEVRSTRFSRGRILYQQWWEPQSNRSPAWRDSCKLLLRHRFTQVGYSASSIGTDLQECASGCVEQFGNAHSPRP